MEKPKKNALFLRRSDNQTRYIPVHDGFDYVDHENAGRGLIRVFQCRSDGLRLFDGEYHADEVELVDARDEPDEPDHG